MKVDWDAIARDVAALVNVAAPIAESLAPEAAPAIIVAQKIILGLVNEEPTAVALVNQIRAGTPPSADQLKAWSDGYEASYQQLHDDIAAALAAPTS